MISFYKIYYREGKIAQLRKHRIRLLFSKRSTDHWWTKVVGDDVPYISEYHQPEKLQILLQ